MCRQRVDDGRGRKRHADRGDLQEPEREAGPREGELGEQGKCDEREGTAGHAAAGHLELPDARECAPHVAALEDCGHYAYAADQHAVLRIAPVEYCRNARVRRESGLQGTIKVEEFYVRSNVRKVRVNSTPEKIPRKRKWRIRRDLSVLSRCSAERTGVAPSSFFVCPPLVLLSVFFELCEVGVLPRVSGNATAKKAVSATRSTSVRIAGAA